MNKQARGLGRGLNAFFGEEAAGSAEQVATVTIKEIVPNRFQPRRVFDEDALAELSESIKQYGILQPIVVRKTVTGFEIVAGERRWRASQLAGLQEIPAVIREYTDSEMTEIALIENIQREDLNPIEEAMAFRRLMNEFGLTQEEVSRKVGRSRSHIANFIRLLNLQPVVQEHVSRGTLSMGQARPLLAIENGELQLEAAETVISEDLSSRDTEEFVKRLLKGPRKPKEETIMPQDEIFVVEAEDRLKLALGTQVRIKPGKLKSKIEIEFYSSEDLDRIIEVLTAQQTAATTKSPAKMIV